MAKPYSLDLRERVVALVRSGKTCRQSGKVYDVSASSVVRWSALDRTTGSPAAKKMGGQKPYRLAGEREWLLARIKEKPDLTLHALLLELEDRGIKVCCDTLWRFLKREGISFKKNAVRNRTG